MARTKTRPYPPALQELMAEKSSALMKAQTFEDMGLDETAVPLWALAASQEERIAPWMEAVGRDLEAAVHRVSAASCYRKAGDPSRAANLYRAALAGPLRTTRGGRSSDSWRLA